MDLRDVPGVKVGHWTDHEGETGCTVVLAPPEGAVASCDVRGSAPGTRETDLLQPGRLVERVHAVMLCGGSAFGLAAATGAMDWLAGRGVGYPAGGTHVPIVPAAVLFDLAVGRADAYPDAAAGVGACVAAERGDGPIEGRIGAGTGATYAKLLRQQSPLPGGVGSFGLRLRGGTTVAAVVVVNALGDVVDTSGDVLGPAGRQRVVDALLDDRDVPPSDLGATNTTLAVVATDAALDKAECRRLAGLAHDGFAQAIQPVHTSYDGDTVFVMSTATDRGPGPPDDPDPVTLGLAVTRVVAEAIRRAPTP